MFLNTHFVAVAVTEQELVFPAAEALRRCEAAIAGYRLARDVAGKALVEIHDQELYRAAGVDDFLLYCGERWQLKRSAVYTLMDHGWLALTHQKNSVATENVTPTPTDAQLRVLKKIRGEGEEESWRKRNDAWTHAVDQLGAEVDPEVLAEFVTQYYSVPRAKRNELSPEEQRERERRQRLAPLERSFKKIVTYMGPEEAAEQLGPISDWRWLSQLEDWLERMREVSS